MADLDGEVLRLDLRPGDVIVYRSQVPMTAEVADRIRQHFATEFPDNRCLVLDGNASLEIVRPDAEAIIKAIKRHNRRNGTATAGI